MNTIIILLTISIIANFLFYHHLKKSKTMLLITIKSLVTQNADLHFRQQKIKEIMTNLRKKTAQITTARND